MPSITCEQLFDEQLKGRSQLIQAAVDGLIRGHGGIPRAPMIANVIINAALRGHAL
jgi:hypothetical protein